MADMMQAMVIDRYDIQSMHLESVPKPAPAPGEVRVKVHAVSINPFDYKVPELRLSEWEFPHILGVDGAGVIDAIGEGVEGFHIGERVAYHGDALGQGTFAQYDLVQATVVAHIPDAVSFVDAAAMPCAGMTAYQAFVRKMHVQPGDYVLIHAANGGVGSFAVQIAKALGAIVIASSSRGQDETLKALGADYCIQHHKENLNARVLDITEGRGADKILNPLGRESSTQDIHHLAFGGHIASLTGVADTTRLPEFKKAYSLHELSLGWGAYNARDPRALQDLGQMLQELLAMQVAGKITPVICEEIAWVNLLDGIGKLQKGGIFGKIVAQIP